MANIPGASEKIAGLFYDKGGAHINVKHPDFGARGDGGTVGTDDTAAFLSCFDVVSDYELIYIPSTPSNYYKVSDVLLLPRNLALNLRGAGRRASRIKQTDPTKNVLDSNGTPATGMNQWDFEDFTLEGGLNGLVWNGVSRSRISNLFIDGAALVGLSLIDCMGLVLRDCTIWRCQDGFKCDSVSSTALNGVLISGFMVELNSRYGIDLNDGGSGIGIEGCTIESNYGGGIHNLTGLSAFHIYGGTYFEENSDHVNPSADIDIGAAATCDGLIEGCYHAGRIVGAAYDYAPLRVKHTSGLRWINNKISHGNRAVVFTAGGSISNSIFGPTKYGDAFDLTDPRTVYEGVPLTFVGLGNRIDDPIVCPVLPGAYFELDEPYCWDVMNLAGTSTFRRSTAVADVGGRKTVAEIVRGTSWAFVTKTITIDAAHNAELRNKYVTFAIPIACMGALSYSTLTVTPDGTGAVVSTRQWGTHFADGIHYSYLNAFVPNDATSVILKLLMDTVDTYYVGKPEFYAGLVQVPVSTALNAALPVWKATAAPTTGIWEVGDRVAQLTPTVGQPKAWACTVAGTPGTWVSEGNL